VYGLWFLCFCLREGGGGDKDKIGIWDLGFGI
jgi:hypothetical protein